MHLEGKVLGTGCQEDACGLVDHPHHFEIVFWFGFQDITASGISRAPSQSIFWGLLLGLPSKCWLSLALCFSLGLSPWKISFSPMAL